MATAPAISGWRRTTCRWGSTMSASAASPSAASRSSTVGGRSKARSSSTMSPTCPASGRTRPRYPIHSGRGSRCDGRSRRRAPAPFSSRSPPSPMTRGNRRKHTLFFSYTSFPDEPSACRPEPPSAVEPHGERLFPKRLDLPAPRALERPQVGAALQGLTHGRVAEQHVDRQTIRDVLVRRLLPGEVLAVLGDDVLQERECREIGTEGGPVGHVYLESMADLAGPLVARRLEGGVPRPDSPETAALGLG